MKAPTLADNKVWRAIWWMTGGSISFVIAAVAVRDLSSHYNALQIGSLRTGGGLLVLSLCLLGSTRLRAQIRIERGTAHIPRNLAHALGGVLWTVAISLLPLVTVFALEFTTPAWAALLAVPIMGESLRRAAIIGIATSFLGVIILLRPLPDSFNVWALLPLFVAFLFGLSVVLTRRLTKSESVFSILFWMMVIQLPINLVGVIVSATEPPSLSPAFGLTATALVLSGLISQFCLAKALSLAPAAVVVPIDFLRVPLIAIVGAMLYGERVDIWVIAGGLIVLLGVYICVAYRERAIDPEAEIT